MKTLTSPSITTSLTTVSTSFDLLNTTATTLNIGGAATAMTLSAATGTTTVNNSLAVNGNTTLGNASGDALTFNSGSWSIPNATTASVTSTLNFDSNTLVVDGTNNRVGVGTATPGTTASTVGTNAAGGIATIVNNSTTASSAVHVLDLKVGNNAGCSSAGSCPRFVNYYKNVSSGDTGGTALGHTRISNTGTGITTTSGAADFAEYMIISTASSDGDIIGFG